MVRCLSFLCFGLRGFRRALSHHCDSPQATATCAGTAPLCFRCNPVPDNRCCRRRTRRSMRPRCRRGARRCRCYLPSRYCWRHVAAQPPVLLAAAAVRRLLAHASVRETRPRTVLWRQMWPQSVGLRRRRPGSAQYATTSSCLVSLPTWSPHSPPRRRPERCASCVLFGLVRAVFGRRPRVVMGAFAVLNGAAASAVLSPPRFRKRFRGAFGDRPHCRVACRRGDRHMCCGLSALFFITNQFAVFPASAAIGMLCGSFWCCWCWRSCALCRRSQGGRSRARRLFGAVDAGGCARWAGGRRAVGRVRGDCLVLLVRAVVRAVPEVAALWDGCVAAARRSWTCGGRRRFARLGSHASHPAWVGVPAGHARAHPFVVRRNA